MSEPLDKFQDREVLGVRAKLTRTGDGLSKSMRLAPMMLSHGDEVMVLTRAVVTHVDTVPHTAKDVHGPLDYVYTFEAQTMMLVDTPQNAKLLARMERQLNEAHEIEGQLSINDELEGQDDEPEWHDDPDAG